MSLKLPVGLSDFLETREGGYTYIDKSLFIRDCIDDSAKVILLTRPRRFGKTSNLSLLRYYFEKTSEPRWHLFQDLAIAEADEAYRAHFQRYPLISLTFKDIKFGTFEACAEAMKGLLSRAYAEHDYLLASGSLKPQEAESFTAILERRADTTLMADALRALSVALHRHHGERVLILLDEYDVPLHHAYLTGYYEPAVTFFRNLLSGGLKDNSSLFKGVLTGILRITKDSIFTGLNNLEVYSLLRPEYAQYFGFTEAEVESLLDQDNAHSHLFQIQRWYNGYLFGGLVIYNPWSVLCFLKSRNKEPAPYWAETSGNDLIRELLIEQGMGLVLEMECLLRGEAIECRLIEQVALRDLRDRTDLLWSFLLMSGYLKVLKKRQDEDGTFWASVEIPNMEVRGI